MMLSDAMDRAAFYLTNALIAFAVMHFVPASASASNPPNIVFIMADDLGLYEVGCYGQKKIRTPEIDRLAAGGMRFTHFYTGNAVCAPSRCCLMTGKHPGHATVRNNFAMKGEGQFPIRAEDITIAELLKTKGYTCGAIGKWGLGMFDTTGSPLRHGFDFFFGYNCQAHAHSHYPTYLYRNADRFELPGNNLATGDTYSHDLFETESIAFVEKHKDRPFFLYLPYTIPHVAVQVPEDSLNEYLGKLGDDPAYDGKKGYRPHPAPHAGYAAMVTRMGRGIGRLMNKLKELKLDTNTLVIFTSDNGPTHNVGGADSNFFDSAGPLRGLKGSLYEGGIRTPFIAFWPGKIAAGSINSDRFAFWDILPTLCELSDATPPSDTDGISLLPTLLGQGTQKKHEFLYWEFSGYGGQQAVIQGDWKAVRQKLGTGKIETELYNLKTDPSESKNVAAENPKVVQGLEMRMNEQHQPSKSFRLQTIDKP